MSKFNRLFEAAKFVGATSIAALSTPGCASECELEPDTPMLENAAEALDYCKKNREATITCLKIEDKGDTLACEAINRRCNAPIEEEVNEIFALNEDAYCVEGDANLLANY